MKERRRTQRHRLLLGFTLALTLAGCECAGLGVESLRFACAEDTDCADGYRCQPVGSGRECVAVDAGAGGGTGGGRGTQDGGDDGGEPDAGPVGGLPEALAITTPPQIIYTASCSQALTIELRDDAGLRSLAPAATAINLETTPAGLGFFNEADCSGGVMTQTTLAQGQGAATVYFRGPTAGTYDVTASSLGLTSATQSQRLVPPPDSLAFITVVPSPFLAGTCQLTTLEARAGTLPSAMAQDTPVGLTVSVTDGVRFFSDASCTVASATTTIPAGASTTSFYLKPITGAPMTVTATASFAAVTANLSPRPVVRRGNCAFNGPTALSDGGSSEDRSETCTIAPAHVDLSHTLLVAQATSSASNPGSGQAACRVLSTSQLRCDRDRGSSSASIHWQTAELPTGLFVQRLTSSTCPALGGAALTLPAAVDPAKSFVLKAVTSGGSVLDDEDLAWFELENATTLRLMPGDCDGYDAQVVQWDGVTVVRGSLDGGLQPGVYARAVAGLPPASTNTALLTQPGTSYATSTATTLCSLLVRGQVSSPSELRFTRGAGVDAGCDVETPDQLRYERADFGARANVKHYTAVLGAGDSSLDVAISPVDVTRTLVFSTSQGTSGQGQGETNLPGTAQNLSEASFRLELTNATTVRVQRQRSAATGVISFQVVEIEP